MNDPIYLGNFDPNSHYVPYDQVFIPPRPVNKIEQIYEDAMFFLKHQFTEFYEKCLIQFEIFKENPEEILKIKKKIIEIFNNLKKVIKKFVARETLSSNSSQINYYGFDPRDFESPDRPIPAYVFEYLPKEAELPSDFPLLPEEVNDTHAGNHKDVVQGKQEFLQSEDPSARREKFAKAAEQRKIYF